MNQAKYPRSVNIDNERKYASFWKRSDMSISHFSRPNMTLTQFLEESTKKVSYIKFPTVSIELKLITPDTFEKSIDTIIRNLHQEKKDKITEEEKTNISREAILYLMKHGLMYHKSAPIINLLISLNSVDENSKKYNNYLDYDDLIIFYLKQICENFTKFDDFLDSMILISEYLSKNLVKNNNNSDDTDSNNSSNKPDNQNTNKNNGNTKKFLNRTTLMENNDTSFSNNDINHFLNEGLFDKIIKYIYCSCRFNIFVLYPIFSAILSILCKTNAYPACELLLNLLLLYKIDFSTSAINSYIDYLCRNNYLDECHELLSSLINYTPEFQISEQIWLLVL